MALLFWITAMFCVSLTDAACDTNCPLTTLNIDSLQNTNCDCERFEKDVCNVCNSPNEDCARRQEIRVNIRWKNSTTYNSSNDWEPPCVERVNSSGIRYNFDWILSSAKTYKNDKIRKQCNTGRRTEDGGLDVYIVLVIISFLLVILAGAFFEQHKRKNITITTLQSKIETLTGAIEVYKRQREVIQIDG